MITLVPLDEACPDFGFDLNKSKSSMMAHAGFQYAEVVEFLESKFARGGPVVMNVILPSMHQALELLTKALILFVDSTITPRKLGHDTLNAMRSYAAHIPVFASILADSQQTAYIQALQLGYIGVRYGEMTISYSGRDIHECLSIALKLIDAYHDLTGIRMLAKHFPTKHEA